MERRRYLESIAASGVAFTAGCLDAVPGLGSRTVLDEPEVDLSAAAHPSHGDDMPEISLPDPISGETVSTADFEGERVQLVTFIYTNCPDGMCPALTLRLRRVQEVAASEDYSDDVALLAMTFDPERDTEDKLRAFADQQGVDAEAENWHFLRPESYDEAKRIMTGPIGLPFEKRDPEEEEEASETNSSEDNSTEAGTSETNSSEDESNDYVFPHYNLILLANENGIVERAYPDGATIDPETVVDDVETVVSS